MAQLSFFVVKWNVGTVVVHATKRANEIGDRYTSVRTAESISFVRISEKSALRMRK